MARNVLKRIMRYAVLAVLCGAGLAWAQMTPQQHQHHLNEIGQYHQQNSRGQQKRGTRGPSAAEVRAWEEREREIQARIARHRATPYWMALAWDFDVNGMNWPGGYRTERRAREKAKQHCRSVNCHVFAAFSNACAVVVTAVDRPRSAKDLFVGIHADDTVAAAQAMQACQAANGVRKDKCFYTGIKTGKGLNGTAFCVGYDHSIYGQK